MELMPFQKEAIGAVVGRLKGRALVALDMGLGKTPVAIASSYLLKSSCTIVVCPASLRLNWEREIENWGAGAHAHLAYDIVNHQGAIH
jgi:SNF2 family DNA or RNA helicase